MRIVLLGRSETERSSVGNMILGRERLKTAKDTEIANGRMEERNIFIIDTPEFFNPGLTEDELKRQMMKSLSLAHPGPHVFLLIVRLHRFAEDTRNLVQKIEETFGIEAFRFLMVLFTTSEVMSKREWIEFRLNRSTRDLLSYCEEKCHVIIHKKRLDRKQISGLLENIEEVVKKNGGEHYHHQMQMKRKNTESEEEPQEICMNNIQQMTEELQIENEVNVTRECESEDVEEVLPMETRTDENSRASGPTMMVDLSWMRKIWKSGPDKCLNGYRVHGREARTTLASETNEKQETEECGTKISGFYNKSRTPKQQDKTESHLTHEAISKRDVRRSFSDWFKIVLMVFVAGLATVAFTRGEINR